ncbi:FMN-binding protein [Actinomadura gamaensis]|uniref:FMN-binding protein n=1 Tax=Actinomadura gamaensis TaxID=1763541 RepID=A0ABV9TVK2_9ACTN
MMRRAVIATSATIAGVSLLLALKPHHSGLAAASGTTGGRTGSGESATAPPSSSESESSGSPGSSGSSGSTKKAAKPSTSGTFTGDAVDTRYGPVQVQVTLKSGKIKAVKVLQVPNENGRDRELASMAVPRLTREALAAGNAQIDTVSGATYTSEGYINSLQSALDKAHA